MPIDGDAWSEFSAAAQVGVSESSSPDDMDLVDDRTTDKLAARTRLDVPGLLGRLNVSTSDERAAERAKANALVLLAGLAETGSKLREEVFAGERAFLRASGMRAAPVGGFNGGTMMNTAVLAPPPQMGPFYAVTK